MEEIKTIDQAINLAAKELPGGYQIEIMVERHGYGVCLVDQAGDKIDIDEFDIKECIIGALEFLRVAT